MIYGFFGGKFLPLHKGHLYCIDRAATECDHVTVIMFINGADEESVMKDNSNNNLLKVEERTKQLERVCALYNNVDFVIIDVANLRDENGDEDWDAETPLVRKYLPKIDYVYSSEPSYEEYFSRAYPEAKHILVDPDRINWPISGTLIRAMHEMEEINKWIV